MGNMISVAKWLGLRGEPMNPEEMQYATQEGKTCRNCLFDGQKYNVCVRAAKAALRSGQEDCGETAVIYVRKDTDPRQLSIGVE